MLVQLVAQFFLPVLATGILLLNCIASPRFNSLPELSHLAKLQQLFPTHNKNVASKSWRETIKEKLTESKLSFKRFFSYVLWVADVLKAVITVQNPPNKSDIRNLHFNFQFGKRKVRCESFKNLKFIIYHRDAPENPTQREAHISKN